MRLAAVVSLALLTSGCRPPYYSIKFVDRAGEPCTAASIDFGPWHETFRSPDHDPGWVNGAERSIGSSYPDPAPTEATIRWTAGGRSYTQTLPLPPRRGEQLRHVTYVFVIRHDGTARAAPIDWDDHGADLKLACDGGPAYAVGIKNATAGPIRNAAVWFGRYPVTGCYVGPGDWARRYRVVWEAGEKGIHQFWHQPFPITETAAVTWDDAAGVGHRREIPLRAALPPDLDGMVLCFLVRDAGVELRVVRHIDLRAGHHPDLDPGWEWRGSSQIRAGVPRWPGPTWVR